MEEITSKKKRFSETSISTEFQGIPAKDQDPVPGMVVSGAKPLIKVIIRLRAWKDVSQGAWVHGDGIHLHL